MPMEQEPQDGLVHPTDLQATSLICYAEVQPCSYVKIRSHTINSFLYILATNKDPSNRRNVASFSSRIRIAKKLQLLPAWLTSDSWHLAWRLKSIRSVRLRELFEMGLISSSTRCRILSSFCCSISAPRLSGPHLSKCHTAAIKKNPKYGLSTPEIIQTRPLAA